MRSPRLRLSIRWMMVVVAVVALAFAGRRWQGRAEIYSGRAAFHAKKAFLIASAFEQFEQYAGRTPGNVMDSASIEDYGDSIVCGYHIVSGPDHEGIRVDDYRAELGRWLLHHRRLEETYRHAAARPWTVVPPDPPAPPRFFFCSQPGVEDPGPIETWWPGR